MEPKENPASAVCWASVLGMVAVGIGLMGITLNFLMLNYILPLVGIGILVSQTARLRELAPAFLTAWKCAVAAAVCMGLNLFTQLCGGFTVAVLLSCASSVLEILFLVYFRKGMEATVGTLSDNDPLLWLCILLGVGFFLAVTSLGQVTIVALAWLVILVVVLVDLYRWGKRLDDDGKELPEA